MILIILALISGFTLLVWSADNFVEGAAAAARHFGIPPLLIGMVILGFGTSAPEMLVSVVAAIQANPGISLGNAFGSNIANIALVLGLTALIHPINVHSRVLRHNLPILTGVTAIAAFLLWNAVLSRGDALVLLGVFGILTVWSIWQGVSKQGDTLGSETEQKLGTQNIPVKKAFMRLVTYISHHGVQKFVIYFQKIK